MALLRDLPIELWLCVGECLPLADVAALALTCVAFVDLFRAKMRLLAQDKNQKLYFLSRFDAEYPHKRLCAECVKYHAFSREDRWIHTHQYSLEDKGQDFIAICYFVSVPMDWVQLVKRAQYYCDQAYSLPLSRLSTYFIGRGFWGHSTKAFVSSGGLLFRIKSTIALPRANLSLINFVNTGQDPIIPLCRCGNRDIQRQVTADATEILRAVRASPRDAYTVYGGSQSTGQENHHNIAPLRKCRSCSMEVRMEVEAYPLRSRQSSDLSADDLYLTMKRYHDLGTLSTHSWNTPKDVLPGPGQRLARDATVGGEVEYSQQKSDNLQPGSSTVEERFQWEARTQSTACWDQPRPLATNSVSGILKWCGGVIGFALGAFRCFGNDDWRSDPSFLPLESYRLALMSGL